VLILKRVALTLLFVVGVVVLLGVLGTLIPYPAAYASREGALANKRILVVSNTIHTDIAIPLDNESLAAFGFLADANLPIWLPQARWVLIGWGGRSFYMETPSLADIKPGPAFRALTLDRSVMHVDVLGEFVGADPSVLELAITDDAYTNLLATISASFARRDGAVEPIEGFAFGANDRFFEAEGGFNALLGCNIWTARMLRSAGITTGLWNPIPSALTTSLRLFNSLPVPSLGSS
jgi:uncharacterized protein (TIGR02117 family)